MEREKLKLWGNNACFIHGDINERGKESFVLIMQNVLVSKLNIAVNGTFWKIVKCQYVAQTEGGKLPQKIFAHQCPKL